MWIVCQVAGHPSFLNCFLAMYPVYIPADARQPAQKRAPVERYSQRRQSSRMRRRMLLRRDWSAWPPGIPQQTHHAAAGVATVE